jgi:6-phosphofructokinase 2
MTDIATLTLNPALDVSTATAALVPSHKLRCAAPRFDAGGGGINVARTITALGGSATAIFPAGGAVGKQLEELLEDAGVAFHAVPIAGTSRQSFAVEETDTELQYRFVLPGPTLSQAEQARCLEQLTRLPHRPRWLVASGSLPPGVPDSFYLMVGEVCRSLGSALLLDTSGAALAACANLHAELIKPSLNELAQAVGRTLATEADELAAARELRARGFAKAVLVSLGDRGALLVSDAVERRFPAIAVPTLNTVGAGDSMLAAVTLGLSRGLALDTAVRLGTAAGAAALLTPGTALARREDVERLAAGLGIDAAAWSMPEALR